MIEIWSHYRGARSKFLKILPIFSIDLLNISQEYSSLHDWIWYLCCERWNLCTTFWFKLGPQALCLFFVFGSKCGCRFLAQVDFKHFTGANGKTLVDYFAIAVRPFSSSSHMQIHDIHTKSGFSTYLLSTISAPSLHPFFHYYINNDHCRLEFMYNFLVQDRPTALLRSLFVFG